MKTPQFRTHYEVYALCSTASDVVECDTLAEAQETARKWSLDTYHEIIIMQVVEVEEERYQYGKRIEKSNN